MPIPWRDSMRFCMTFWRSCRALWTPPNLAGLSPLYHIYSHITYDLCPRNVLDFSRPLKTDSQRVGELLHFLLHVWRCPKQQTWKKMKKTWNIAFKTKYLKCSHWNTILISSPLTCKNSSSRLTRSFRPLQEVQRTKDIKWHSIENRFLHRNHIALIYDRCWWSYDTLCRIFTASKQVMSQKHTISKSSSPATKATTNPETLPHSVEPGHGGHCKRAAQMPGQNQPKSATCKIL